MENPLLSIKDLSVSFNTNEGKFNAVDGVSFDINKGEIFALVGESGCGKSTTAFGIMRLIPKPGNISQGKIIFDGKNLVELPKMKYQIRGKKSV